jgi:bacterial/archaeal transporter family-2 protein
MPNENQDNPPPSIGQIWATMDQFFYIGLAICAGIISATQVGLIGVVTRDRGPFEATWISMLGSLAGMALLLGLMAFLGRRPEFSMPFNSMLVYLVLSAIMTTSLLIAGQGLPHYVLVTGLTSIPYLLVASWTGPKIGIAVFFAAVVTGQLAGSVALDHFGAFGTTPRPFDLARGVGILALLAGVVLIRGSG